MKKYMFRFVAALALVGLSSIAVWADTVRLKDGSVIRGQIVGFKEQQFTIVVGSGTKGRFNRINIYTEDVESIEFDGQIADNGNTGGGNSGGGNTGGGTNASDRFLNFQAQVAADSRNNGWTNTGIVLRRGQRVRISATGTVSLGRAAGQSNVTPAGVPSLRDARKLMPNDPTGGLIAVIGDDNDDFIFVGRNREFIAQRDGVLFLGINEDYLNDNTGAFSSNIEVSLR